LRAGIDQPERMLLMIRAFRTPARVKIASCAAATSGTHVSFR
jgi:hypothetical protein